MPVSRHRPGRFAFLLALVAVVFSAVVYAPLVSNYFHGDDFLNLFQIRNMPPFEYLLTTHGGHVLVTRNAVFYLCAKAFGTNAAGFYWVVLLTHLLNVWLLFRVIRRFTDSVRLACFGATLFGTCPAAEGTLGWYSVYGQVLVATAFLVILDQVERAAAERAIPSVWRRLLWYILALVAMTSFGVGIGLALTLPVVIVLLVPEWRQWSRRPLPPLLSLVIAVPVLYLLLVSARALLGGGESIISAQFLAAEAVANWINLFPMLFHLTAYAAMRLAVGFVPPPPYPSTVGTVAIGSLLAAAGLVVLLGPPRRRRQVLACIVMAASCYGMIALGRVFFYTNAGELGIGDIVGQSRYHYVGLLPLVLLACVVLARLGGSRRSWSWVKNVLLCLWLAAWAVSYWQFGLRIDHHGKSRRETMRVVNWMSAHFKRAPEEAPVYLFNRSLSAVSPLWISSERFPGWAAVFTIFFDDNTVDGHRVYFIERHPSLIESLQSGRRTAGLFVAPEDVPGPLGEALREAIERRKERP